MGGGCRLQSSSGFKVLKRFDGRFIGGEPKKGEREALISIKKSLRGLGSIDKRHV